MEATILDALNVRCDMTWISSLEDRFDTSDIFTTNDWIYEDWEMPDFILQPIVENAINHGLRNSGRPDRLLTISLQVTSGEAVFCISDNGVGIPDDILATLKARQLPTT